jgi:hypothetical protein
MAIQNERREIPQAWQKLRAEGWVNVTGLETYQHMKTESDGMILPSTNRTTAYGYNNGRSVIYLADGTVWFRTGEFSCPSCPLTLGEFDPITFSAWVPCSNGEMPKINDFVERVANPFWNGGKARNYQLEGKPELGYVNYPATWEEMQDHPTFLAHRAEVVSRPVNV